MAFGTSLRFDANLSILFTELPLLDRPAAAAKAGFDAVELWWPWVDAPVPAPHQLDALRRALEDAGTQLVGLNFYAGELPGPDKGAASVPALSDAFRANVPVAAEFARRVGCGALNALYGNRVAGVPAEEQDALALRNLAYAAEAAAAADAVLLVEALNRPEAPDYPLITSAEALAVVERINAATGLGNARFLLDVYHLARTGEEDVAAVISAHGADVGHVQIADHPGRGEPGTGTLDFAALLGALERSGYTGRVGAEYKPSTGATDTSFGWLTK
ncbi:hydroxypyruvate isomerase [Mangrovactinospora gilvigrisea]|uniref:Hydroxypyruvate isomerase n=1 Tax=Mangrovactinospora gilvigrisea TaxID=1428644 RepID=A0A1J7C844_9ACTN|nr:TIM barrel protein [Mangrovactinospora gilvigrisea]OIV37696.1 hydroxypyruvate isomerase [Mangrovactinospora gilvigrisea]